MPELPEVETTIRGLARFLDGERLERVELRRANLRRPFPEDLVQRLTGARVTGLSRRAKYGLIGTDRGATMVFHLGMSGRWRIDPSDIGTHDHLVMETTGHRFALCDPRRFGSVDLLESDSLDQWSSFATMGPEPLGPDLTAEHLHRAFAGRKQAVKLLLLDQRIVAGLGNIYVCEALYRAHINPVKAGGRISLAALKRLIPAIQAVLYEAIEAGGSSLRDYAQPDGQLGYFSKQFDVYGREAEPCACGGTIKRIAQGGRSTWYCPSCQR
ncbi:bifunctional DNA-formamidopyrimidine glycosylase/DNA-(apurinic or apyrimidinic site) lyase [Altericroceibacterium endophyticum]|uniref:Formamidopyrimidine-DNA glycosylase n=1 Tax=Altericroceibacterium endophyticum TaxID=1808508 RepID=A0A6I4T1M0_9SPHN|nr:bifunctional DNA-formamidopyrimidine glycosylase/DNA-(apurinic or apyrimidinic site) lyase [Altericroceibacterium endophyticum]MXO65094.1 bifunctional DNA-formamidopyrimidine glycosylase/DNA-(apurinic or apyrimidinic site) lyase [Altericroceibacterium endophyticum]